MNESATVPDDPRPSAARFCRTCGRAVEPEVEICTCGESPRSGSNFCPACGDPTYADERVCRQCGGNIVREGHSSRTIVGSRGTSPLAMAILSLIIPWLGQLLMGQTTKAIVLFIATVLSALMAQKDAWVIWIVAPVDAYWLAKRLRAGKAIGRWDFF